MNLPSTRVAAGSDGKVASQDATILVVDDIEANRDLLVRRLNRLGITSVVQANDGRAALDAIRSRPFDLVLLDIMMPVMTGFDVISAMGEMDAVVRAISLGAEDFLLKPFDPVLLRARVLATLEKKQLRDGMREELARKQAELGEARCLQLALSPPPYRDERLSIDVVLEPAREVGGDLIDHIILQDDEHVLVLGDVSDKGAAAALVMARTHALMRGLSTRPDSSALFDDLGKVASALNHELSVGNQSCMFVTMFIALFRPSQGRLDYIRCGHVPPFLLRANGGIERLDAPGGPPLGVTEAVRYAGVTVRVAPGDRLLVLSDGVTEACAPDGTLFGDERVEAWLSTGPSLPDSLVEAVRLHEAGGAPSDDVAALLLTVQVSNQ
jgi:sigma-B regulation protein RsbU (phosphoserine phosphatase)